MTTPGETPPDATSEYNRLFFERSIAYVQFQFPLFVCFYIQCLTESELLAPHNGVGTNFGVGVGEARPEGPRAGDGVHGEGAASPSPPDRGLRDCCKLPQRGPGQSPGHRRVFLYSEPPDCLSQHLSRPMCCIQFAWLSIRFFYRGIYISISPT